MSYSTGASVTRGSSFINGAVVLALTLVGASAVTGCTATDVIAPVREIVGIRPAVAPTPSKPGALLVVFTYGFGCDGNGPGNGLRDVADTIRKQYPDQQVITRGWDDNDGIAQTIENHVGPVALVGHSFGGCRSLQLAMGARRTVDHLILLDPVPCEDWGWRHAGRYFEVPARVAKAVCFYRPPALWPLSYSLVNPASPSDNHLMHIGHAAFGENAEVRQYIMGVCAQAFSDAQRARDAVAATRPPLASIH